MKNGKTYFCILLLFFVFLFLQRKNFLLLLLPFKSDHHFLTVAIIIFPSVSLLSPCFWFCRRFDLTDAVLFIFSLYRLTAQPMTTTLHFKLKWKCQQIAAAVAVAVAVKSAFLYRFFFPVFSWLSEQQQKQQQQWQLQAASSFSVEAKWATKYKWESRSKILANTFRSETAF